LTKEISNFSHGHLISRASLFREHCSLFWHVVDFVPFCYVVTTLFHWEWVKVLGEFDLHNFLEGIVEEKKISFSSHTSYLLSSENVYFLPL